MYEQNVSFITDWHHIIITSPHNLFNHSRTTILNLGKALSKR